MEVVQYKSRPLNTQSRKSWRRLARWLLLFASAPLWALLFAVLDQALVVFLRRGTFSLSPPALLPALAPLGALPLAATALGIDTWVRGYSHSALKRILNASPSAEADLFHAFLYISNLKNILGLVFGLGIGHLMHHWILENYSPSLLRGAGFLPGLAALLFVNSFLFYWVHRAMHSPLFWPVHKVHHSATEMNLITNFRNHPLNIVVEFFFYSISAALLGVSFTVTMTYAALNGIYQLFAHSESYWNLRGDRWSILQNWILIAPEEHRIHHSSAPEHWDKNFGFTPLWDRVFGTWQPAEGGQNLVLGLADETDQKIFCSFQGVFIFAARFFINTRNLLIPANWRKKDYFPSNLFDVEAYSAEESHTTLLVPEKIHEQNGLNRRPF